MSLWAYGVKIHWGVLLEASMETITLKVKGMNCGHCVNAVRSAIAEVTGVGDAIVSLEDGTATYVADPATLDSVKDAIAEEGFSVQD